MSGQLVPEAGGPVASPRAFPRGSPGESGEVSSACLPPLQFWQLYNAVTLFELSSHEECREWQVFVLALTFLVLFLGNFLTTLKVVHAKLQKNRNKAKQP